MAELQDIKVLPQTEMSSILDEVLDIPEYNFVSQLEKINKVIIMDKDFNKIREAFLDKDQNTNNQSMLQPFINRSQFITKVHNVSYYVLEKNK